MKMIILLHLFSYLQSRRRKRNQSYCNCNGRCLVAIYLFHQNDPAGQWSDSDPTTGTTGIKLGTGY